MSIFGLEQRHSATVHELVIAPLEAQWKEEVHNFNVISCFRSISVESQRC